MALPQRVADLLPGAASSYPDHLTVMGDALYFIAEYGTKGVELWRTNGTAAGTTVVREIRADTNSSFFNQSANGPYDYSSFAALGNTLYFAATDGALGFELWSTNGSDQGTQLTTDVRPGSAGSTPQSLTAVGSLLFFVADDGSGAGNQLWRFDGSSSQRLSSTQAKLPSTPSMWASGNAFRRAAMPCPSPLPASRMRACAGSCTTEGRSRSASTGVGNRGASRQARKGYRLNSRASKASQAQGGTADSPSVSAKDRGSPPKITTLRKRPRT